ncbi:MAG: SH3 domain-containing protein [Pseudolabrys sp.]
MNIKQFSLAAGFVLASAGIAAAAPAMVTGDLNLRSGPGTGYSVIDTMPAGAAVNVLGCRGSWCRVGWGGTVGYASASYLGLGGPVYAAAPPPVYVAPPPMVSFGFSTGPRWHSRHWGHGRPYGRHYRRHR